MGFVEKAVERMKEVNSVKSKNRSLSPPRQPLAKKVNSRDPDVPEDHTQTIVIDHDRLQAAGFIARSKFERQLAEEYRRVKRPLLDKAVGPSESRVRRGNLIMLASALSGEGKTHTCINLALSMAMETDRTVLLVDADVAKPTISRLFGLAEEKGLLDLLSGDVSDIRQVLVRTNIRNLRVLPAGIPRDQATELLASDRTRELAEELHSRYSDRVILFDSSPLLATTESPVLATLVGQVAMVVAADSTPRMAVRQALSLLDPKQSVSLILNKAQRRSGSHYGYYGSYGAYGQADEETGHDKRK